MTSDNDQSVPKVKVNEVEIVTARRAHQVGAMSVAPRESLPDPVLTEMSPERIAWRLRLLREALGMTKSQISDDLGIERTYWSRFENGVRPVSYHVGALLVARYGVTLDFLILGRWDKLPVDLSASLRKAEARIKSSSD